MYAKYASAFQAETYPLSIDSLKFLLKLNGTLMVDFDHFQIFRAKFP
jgi:hypothetical protein